MTNLELLKSIDPMKIHSIKDYDEYVKLSKMVANDLTKAYNANIQNFKKFFVDTISQGAGTIIIKLDTNEWLELIIALDYVAAETHNHGFDLTKTFNMLCANSKCTQLPDGSKIGSLKATSDLQNAVEMCLTEATISFAKFFANDYRNHPNKYSENDVVRYKEIDELRRKIEEKDGAIRHEKN